MTMRSHRTRQQLREMIDGVVAFARDRLDDAAAEEAAAYIALFYASVPPHDLAAASVENLYGSALSLWQLARRRRPGTTSVRAYNPRLEEDGWHSPHTVVEIVNDDMPFLVDSVAAELNRHGLTVHLVIHPIVEVPRAPDGAIGGPPRPAGSQAGLRESHMHIEVDEQSQPESLAALRADIERVLADVRAAVEDWQPMRARIHEAADTLQNEPAPAGAAAVAVAPYEDERREAVDFLRWAADNHFTLLGYREYDLTVEGETVRAETVPAAGLGLMRTERLAARGAPSGLEGLPPEVLAALRDPTPVTISKTGSRSTVHRPTHMDIIGVKRLDAAGRLVGERRFVGLFTSTVFTTSPRAIPILRRKVARCIERAGFPANGHDEKALVHILETFPRDELFQATVDELFDIVIGILHLQERQRIALFVRRDPLERFVSCFVFVPRDRYDMDLRERIRAILEEAFAGRTTAFRTQVGDEPLARLHFVLETTPGSIPDIEPREIERRIVEAGRSWPDRLRAALIEAHGEEAGLQLFRLYGDAFPAGYREASGAEAALLDIRRIEEALARGRLAMNLYHPIEAPPERVRFKIYHPAEPVPLSDVLPMMENMGLRVIGEVPYAVRPADADAPVWIHDFEMVTAAGEPVELRAVRADFQEAFAGLWAGTIESDGFNALVLAGGLTARQVVVIRALSRFLRQAAVPFSPAYLEETIVRHAGIASRIVALFEAKFALDDHRDDRMAVIRAEIDAGLDTVTSLDEDRILRRFVNLVDAALRTNYCQRSADGAPKPWLSIKFDSARIEELPLPRPLYEIFVYAPRMEGAHLRGGKVARGGIRWSDRREDFRTEILGLMKAQMVKNAVIVPVGSKGGFVVKRPPAEGGRDALQAEGIECYRTLLRGMLDITDNLVEGAVVPPADVVRHDGDDPYLVVAADKGTASFSDIANAVAAEYGFWLGDAFASGGSAGYDHKGMGITARGAWESVKRHFRELGRDIQTQDFTCVGVGDMSGDVFGNGMLLSRHTRLVGAFNHMHVFVDPDPDAETGWAERRRLFDTPRSTWADYDRALLSTGGGVFERTAKSVTLSPEAQALFGLTRREVTPAALIRAMLKAEVDLLWFGGIGTYVKSTEESDAEVGDRGNDPVRVNGADLRARVLGEGANLGVTQRGRIEYAAASGRINTDFIDNVSGVDTSDHEVNIKILLGKIVAEGDMTLKQRNALMVEMADDVARLVLRNNYLQGQGLSVTASTAPRTIGPHGRFIRMLERAGALDRTIEQLPDEEELAEREASGRGLTRPELAILVSYGKMWLYDTLLASDLPDEPRLVDDLVAYFPPALAGPHREAIARHPLRREIVTTVVTNAIVDRAGFTFVQDVIDRTGRPPGDVARAFAIAREVFGVPDLWAAIEALDARVDAGLQIRMLLDCTRLLERGTRWFLRHVDGPLDMAELAARFEPGVGRYCERLTEVLPERLAEETRQAAAHLAAEAVPEPLAHRIAGLDLLGTAPDVVRIAESGGIAVDAAARCFFAVGERLHLDWLRGIAETFPAETTWQRRAAEAIADDLYGHQGRLAAGVVRNGGDLAAWTAARAGDIERLDRLVEELRGAATVELAMLTVANGALRALHGD